MGEKGAEVADFAPELRGDLAIEKVMNINSFTVLEKRQIQLKTLEDSKNEMLVVFAVDKLNDGWDVLNMFDIVRPYDTFDGKANKVGKGDRLRPNDDWKQTFLVETSDHARLETLFRSKDFKVYGLPLFNEHGQTNVDFKEVFENGI